MFRALMLCAPLLIALAGCGDGGAARMAFLTSLIGQNETDLVRLLGVPSRTYETAGRKFLAYDQRRLDIVPVGPLYGGFGYGGFGYGGFGRWGPGFGPYAAFPPVVVERGCETTFELAGGRVAAWALRGSLCV